MTLVAINVTLMADKFEWREWVRTGAGFNMTATDFAYMSNHQAIEKADINGDGLMDIVLLSDGALTSANDYTDGAGGTIPIGAYLDGYGGAGHNSPNIRAGLRGDLWGQTFSGSDIAWMENIGYGYFIYHFIPANIYHGQTLRVDDIDKDGDTDIVVWCGSGFPSASVDGDASLGAIRVAWFENRQVPGVFNPDGSPVFIQRDILTSANDSTVFGGIAYRVTDPSAGTLVDMDGDTYLDVVVLNSNGGGVSNSIFYWIKNVTGSFSFDAANVRPITNTSGTHYNKDDATVVVSTDVNKDGFPDFAIGENGGGDRLRYLENDTTGKFDINSLASITTPKALWVGELVDGGHLEIIAGGERNRPIKVFYHDGGVWRSKDLSRNGSERDVWDVRVADFNGDGNMDIICFYVDDQDTLFDTTLAAMTPPRYSVISLYPGTGNHDYDDWEPFALAEKTNLPDIGTRPGGGLAVADFDGDTDMDVIRCHWGANIAYFENTWHTERHTEIITEVKKGDLKLNVKSTYSIKGDNSIDKRIGMKVLKK